MYRNKVLAIQMMATLSRRFFMDPQLAAEITGLNEEIITRFKVIFEVISSGHDINIKKFNMYANDTANLYVALYS